MSQFAYIFVHFVKILLIISKNDYMINLMVPDLEPYIAKDL
jgi:hypothetical protein